MKPAIRPRLLVGLTGGIGSGKTTVANLFGALGVPLIDTDLIAHELTAPGGAAIASIRAGFGDAAIAPDGSLDRAAMRARAFADPDARRRLEAILHPMIRERTVRAIEAAAHEPYAIVIVPLLVESGTWQSWLDRILVVDCPVQVQIERVMTRSALAREQVLAILGAQATREARLAAADDVIDNTGPVHALRERVEALHRSYLALAS